MAAAPKILAFCGSARKESLNQKLLNVTVDAVRAAGGEVTLVSLRDYPLPLYDGDLEDASGLPDNARKLIDLIKAHAGLLVASPEYNSMITPLLKNTIDWCTRDDDNNPFPGRIAAVVSASPGALGGIRSLKMAQQLLLHLGCHVVPGNTMLPQAHKAFGDDGKLTDLRTQKSVQELAARLVETVRKLG
ncbi:MAG TPA: NAD(P)H-dependent oxidoreductase [Lacunisphaera sp.]|nr:NAD(P)H-dependent oxidoreductase [Lacunisphaera sp.]